MTTRDVEAVLADGRTVAVTLRLAEAAPWTIRAEGEGMPGDSFPGRDAFDALTALRRVLDAQGARLLVAGARRDTYPSGMSRDMAAGRAVYQVELGRGVTTPPVDIFAPADAAEIGTVEAQDAYRQRWIESLRALT